VNKVVKKSEVTNGGKAVIDLSQPYTVNVVIEGTADFLFHRWNDVAEKAAAAKGSKAKKTDDIETYVYRDETGNLCIPGEYLRMSIINAAKFKQDPRSPRKSAMDLYKAGIVSMTNLASLNVKEWDYEDRRRVTIQRNGVTRVRPAMRKGYRVEFQIMVNLPEYIDPIALRETIEQAGRLIGIGDFRPTFGRFGVVKFDLAF
jgi:hypothetical protein